MGYFRDQLIAASLKQAAAEPHPAGRLHFRDQLIAASLKLIDRDRGDRGLLDFRDQLIAASLKRIVPRHHMKPAISFPRSTDRGLIEASPIGMSL